MSTATSPLGALPEPCLEAETAEKNHQLNATINAFFERNGFGSATRKTCDDYARQTYALAEATPSAKQGYCSYTLKLPSEYLLQFRPRKFALDRSICAQARSIFPNLSPKTEHVGTVRGEVKNGTAHGGDLELQVYLQMEITGVTLADFRKAQGPSAQEKRRDYRHALVEDMAGFFAQSYMHRRYPGKPGDDFPRGNVGTSLKDRLRILERLPKEHTKFSDAVRRRIDEMKTSMAWCLTHGDLVPENIMVDPTTGRLTGLVDWAEGEWLPFGVGLYGLEELFGEIDLGGVFELYPDHEQLRDTFWRRFLQITRPPVAIFSNMWLGDLRLCRRFGIMLWRGIAFDDGKLDRVVDAERDAVDMRKLELSLNAPEPLEGAGWRWKVELLRLCLKRCFESRG